MIYGRSIFTEEKKKNCEVEDDVFTILPLMRKKMISWRFEHGYDGSKALSY